MGKTNVVRGESSSDGDRDETTKGILISREDLVLELDVLDHDLAFDLGQLIGHSFVVDLGIVVGCDPVC